LPGFAGFFRYNELASLREADGTIFPDHMELFLESSKTDQYRDGAHIVITRTNSQICPVTMMERYMSLTCATSSLDKFLFRGLSKRRDGYRLGASESLSYSRVRELVLKNLIALGFDK